MLLTAKGAVEPVAAAETTSLSALVISHHSDSHAPTRMDWRGAAQTILPSALPMTCYSASRAVSTAK